MTGRSRSLKPSGICRRISIEKTVREKFGRTFRSCLTLVDAIVEFGFLVGPQSKDVDKSFPIA